MSVNWIWIIAILVVYLLGNHNIANFVKRIGAERNIIKTRIQYVATFIKALWTLIAVVALAAVTGIDFKDFGFFFSSLFAVIGVALFAQWSILSNVSASVIVFFLFPYRVGDYVRILNGDNSVEGTIEEITLFHVILIDNDKNVVTYPNSMVFQAPVKITKKPVGAELKSEPIKSDNVDEPSKQ